MFTATVCSNKHAAARPGSAHLGTARQGEDTALTIHVTVYNNIYKGLCQSGLSTADHALSLVAPATTAV
jgi:hypothetical protein